MKLICAWCGSAIERSGYNEIGDSDASHGMCPACWQALASQENGVSLQRHIDSIPIPILLVDSNNATLRMNEKASETLGSNAEATKGIQFGLVFDCLHSHFPEGCGRSIHCSGCVIRRTVAETFSTGQPQIAVPATLRVDSADQPSDVVFTITTVKSGKFVLMRIEK
jgi:hypothetical protein